MAFAIRALVLPAVACSSRVVRTANRDGVRLPKMRPVVRLNTRLQAFPAFWQVDSTSAPARKTAFQKYHDRECFKVNVYMLLSVIFTLAGWVW
jgi:hypothetical protein